MLLWWIANHPFAAEATEAISDPANDVTVSAASAWEIAIKSAQGKLDAPDDFEAQLDRHGFALLPIGLAHALSAGSLPRHHGDPFDRMLIAQALTEGLTIVTRDRRFAAYGVPVLAA